MAKVKDFLLGIQELVWTALELGARNTDTVFAYVYQYEPRADIETVQYILEDIWNGDEAEYLWA